LAEVFFGKALMELSIANEEAALGSKIIFVK
jgi:hypothetical protein